MAAKKQNFVILQGETFQRVIRWEALPFVYKAITGVTRAAPAVVTAVGHNLVTGWRTAIVSVLGATEINAKYTPPRDTDFHQCVRLDADTVSFNDINSADYSAYTSGGYLQYYTPVDLTGYDAVMEIKDRIGGTVLMTLSVTNGRIVLDAANHTITLNIPYTDLESAVLTWTKGVYDLEMKSPSGGKVRIYQGNISVSRETTT